MAPLLSTFPKLCHLNACNACFRRGAILGTCTPKLPNTFISHQNAMVEYRIPKGAVLAWVSAKYPCLIAVQLLRKELSNKFVMKADLYAVVEWTSLNIVKI